MENKYIVIKEPKQFLEAEAYGPFSVDELHEFLKTINNVNLTILPLRRVKEYAD